MVSQYIQQNHVRILDTLVASVNALWRDAHSIKMYNGDEVITFYG